VGRETLLELNPGFTPMARRSEVRLPAGFELMVPTDAYDAFASAYKDPETAPARHDEQVDFAQYRVGRGQNLTYIARKTGTSLFAILHENEMDLDTANALRVGQKLRIPTARYLSLARKRAKASPRPSAFDLHRVRRGESVRAIERRHGLATGELKKWNDIGENLRAGAVLSIPIYL
jgi:LysM repeat protein